MSDTDILPLSGFTVLEVNDRDVPLCLRLATSLAGKIAADLGATVLKIEPPQGDPVRRAPPFLPQGDSALFQFLNTSKRSVALDLSSDTGRPALAKLLADCRCGSVRGACVDRGPRARRPRDADRDRGVSGGDGRRVAAGQRIHAAGIERPAAHGGRARAQAAAAGRPPGVVCRRPDRFHRPHRRRWPHATPDKSRPRCACRSPKSCSG